MLVPIERVGTGFPRKLLDGLVPRLKQLEVEESPFSKDDTDALLRAEELLAGSSFPVIEVWQAERLVGRLSRRASV